MDGAPILKAALSGLVLVACALLYMVLQSYARSTQRKLGLRKSRYFAIRRLLRMVSFVFGLILLLLVWDVNLKHMWVQVAGFLAVIAIAFFAVWSLLGNILAGLVIYFTSPFKLDDEIEVMPDEIGGTVLAINTFFTLLQDKQGRYINVPNALLFQKYIRVKAGGAPSEALCPEVDTPVGSKGAGGSEPSS